MNVVTIQNVSKKFQKIEVLHHVSLTFEPGTIVGLVGRNGSGKTVLLKLICGLLRCSEGHIFVHGEEIGVQRDFPKRTGVFIETPEFLPYQTAYQNLYSLWSITKRTEKQTIRQRIEQVGLDASSKKPVGKYSLGMRQRLGIAQTLLDEPDLLLLDEPMNGLDASGMEEMRRLFRALRNQGKTIVLATHIKEDIQGLCDVVYRVQEGTVQKVETNDEKIN